MKQEFLVLVLCVVFLCQGAAAGSLFYEGGLTVNAIRADVDISSMADADIVYTIVNTGNAREQAALQAAAGSGQVQNIVLEPGQQTEVRFRYTVSPAGDKVRTLSLDPALLINGKPPAERVQNISVTLKLPAGVPALISSNRDFIAGNARTGRAGRNSYGAQRISTRQRYRQNGARSGRTLSLKKRSLLRRSRRQTRSAR